MPAEMTIKLVDNTEPETQDAFNRSLSDIPQGSPSVDASSTRLASSVSDLVDHLKQQSGEGATGVDQLQETVAEIVKEKKQGEESRSSSRSEQPTQDDYRDLRHAILELSRKLTPEWIAEPIDRLIRALSAPESKSEKPKLLPSPATPAAPATTEIPEVKPVVATEKPKSTTATTQPSVSDVVNRLRGLLEKSKVGQSVLKVADKSVKAARAVGRSARTGTQFLKSKLQKTKAGRSFLKFGSQVKADAKSLFRKAASSSVGKAVSNIGRSAVGIAGRAIGATASTAAASGGTAAATSVAGGGAAAGAGVAGVAAVANPVGATVVAVGATVAALAAMTLAAKGAADALSHMTSNLEDKSPEIANAKARGQITTEVNLFNRAKAIGPEMAQIENARNRISDAQEKLLTQILTILVKAAPAIDLGANTLVALLSAGQVASAALEQVIAEITPDGGKDNAVAAQHRKDADLAFANAMKDLFGDPNANNNQPDPMLMQLLVPPGQAMGGNP